MLDTAVGGGDEESLGYVPLPLGLIQRGYAIGMGLRSRDWHLCSRMSKGLSSQQSARTHVGSISSGSGTTAKWKLECEIREDLWDPLRVFKMALYNFRQVHILDPVNILDGVETGNVSHCQRGGAVQILEDPVVPAVAVDEASCHQHPHSAPALHGRNLYGCPAQNNVMDDSQVRVGVL